MTDTSAATGLLLAYSMLKGVGPSTLRKIAALPKFPLVSVDSVIEALPSVRKAITDTSSWSIALEMAYAQLDQVEAFEGRVLSPLDAEYPSLLAQTKDDPFLLYVRGKLHVAPEQSIAIIGTREPTDRGKRTVFKITEYFVEQQWSIVSGLALGCDSLAHDAAVQTGGHTVAVLAHGLHTIAPARNRRLAEQILESGGALVSQFPFGHAAMPKQFVQRDRVQAGLAVAVVMTQSDLKGGSLHASRAALDYERALIVPYPASADLANKEPKIQANLLLAEGLPHEKADLLRCPLMKLSKIFVLRGKEDYPALISQLQSSSASPHVPQASFI